MARNTQFSAIVSQLRAELRRSTNVAVGVEDIDSLKQTINRVYNTLYLEYDWPHLRRVFPRVGLQSGQRFYDFPSGLDLERVESAAVWYSNLPHKIERGIDFKEYAGFNSYDGITSEPALRWDVRYNGNAVQFEIWPIPSSNGQQVEFIGFQEAPRLVNDADICLLDDNLIVLFAAAELAASGKTPDADVKMKAAQAHFARLKARGKVGSQQFKMGLGEVNPTSNGRATVRVR